ncbi:hypothetical protein [Aquisalibacillus elongatus]|uniref:YobI-like P-loop NTPase domain-containing protein n=1 Tax=Aquisalibacillus elongatus TaxID=485577 RepID=A0A3N5C465_9BACI|nr:hypothetical protein [Aquisalibacillus elongatus]RPF57028.1 hypothetical protein EDC24_0076 [Aquisalibacillus elongatus]
MEQLIEYESLSAKKELDEDSEFYLDTLNKALEDEDNKNIAITGGYGAGKTTIIDSYFEENKNKKSKMMRVSIATFQPNEESSNSSDNILEQQILQQMFLQVNPNKIPKSNFTKLSDLSFWRLFVCLFYFLFTVVFTVLMVSNGWFNQFFSSLNFLGLLLLIPLIVLNGFSVFLLLHFFKKIGVSKFGFASTNFEVNFEDGSTVFNHYLDEIIYLFNKTDFQYIIFEDLDRFQSIEIFEKLRSLNIALNRSAQLKDRDIKFIYALKDDVFTGKDETESIYNRTKFFDFIIPTVKVMHSSNAESILLNKLDNFLPNKVDKVSNDNINRQQLSRILIEDVALFINDMRTLINICNEFEIFRMRLQKSSVTYDHLFAFIVYKNIYPKDYSDLLENKGLVFEVFNNKEKIAKFLEGRINELNNISINGLGSIITEKDDLAMLFTRKRNITNQKIVKNSVPLISIPNVQGTNYASNGKRVLDYLINKGIEGEFYIYRNGNPIKQYSNFEEFVTINSVNYLELYKDFDKKYENKADEIRDQVSELQKTIKYVRTKSISRLIKEDEIDLHVDLSNNKLLYFLIRNNWLNESYEDYLTVFREGSLSKKDNEFIQSVKLGYDENKLFQDLKNESKVAGKIRVDDINGRSVLNTKLIVHLLENDNDINREKLKQIFRIAFSDLVIHFDELMELLKDLKETISDENLLSKFLNLSKIVEIDIWDAVNGADKSNDQKDDYVMILLKYYDVRHLIDNSFLHLSEYISNDFDVKKLTNSKDIILSIEKLEAKFTSISEIEEETILEYVIHVNAFQINLVNLRKIFGVNDISIELIQSDERIYDYCLADENIEAFIDVLIQQEEYNEKEVIFVNFVGQLIDNDKHSDTSLIGSMIRKWSGMISDLSKIDSLELIMQLYIERKIQLTWNNLEYCSYIFTLYEEEFDIETLLSTERSWKKLIENSTEEVQEAFKQDEKYNNFLIPILKLKPVNHLYIKKFIKQLMFPVELEDKTDIDVDVLDLLIKNQKLYWNRKIYNSIQSKQLKEMFVYDCFDTAQNELEDMIEEEELVWSLRLFNSIVKIDGLRSSLIQQYIRDNLSKINYQDFKSISDNYKLEFDNTLIKTLVEQNKGEILILYLVEQWRRGIVDGVSDVVQDLNINWSEELLNEFRKDDVEVAVDYLLNHIDKVYEVNMDQKLFNTFVEKANDIEIVIELINKYQNKLVINERISDKLYEFQLSNPEIVFDLLNQNAVIDTVTLLPLEASAEFLHQYLVIKNLNRRSVFELLSKLDEPFSLIKVNGRRIKIEAKHPEVKNLLDYLESNKLNVVSSVKSIEDGYVVNNKRK